MFQFIWQVSKIKQTLLPDAKDGPVRSVLKTYYDHTQVYFHFSTFCWIFHVKLFIIEDTQHLNIKVLASICLCCCGVFFPVLLHLLLYLWVLEDFLFWHNSLCFYLVNCNPDEIILRNCLHISDFSYIYIYIYNKTAANKWSGFSSARYYPGFWSQRSDNKVSSLAVI